MDAITTPPSTERRDVSGGVVVTSTVGGEAFCSSSSKALAGVPLPPKVVKKHRSRTQSALIERVNNGEIIRFSAFVGTKCDKIIVRRSAPAGSPSAKNNIHHKRPFARRKQGRGARQKPHGERRGCPCLRKKERGIVRLSFSARTCERDDNGALYTRILPISNGEVIGFSAIFGLQSNKIIVFRRFPTCGAPSKNNICGNRPTGSRKLRRRTRGATQS